MISVAVTLCEGGKARAHEAGLSLRNAMLSSLLPSLKADDFCTLPHGKPALISGDIGFSVSHSGNAVCCAVAADRPTANPEKAFCLTLPCDGVTEVGIDIELVRPRPLFRRKGVAKRFWSAEESAAAGDDLIKFYEIHTKKEALCKMSGLGLADYRRCSLSRTDAETDTRTLSLDGETYVLSVAFYRENGKKT